MFKLKPNLPFQFLVSQLQKCSNLRDLESIYAPMIKNSSNQDCYLINQFIGFCGTFRRMDLATLAFTQMELPNVFVYNAMFRGFVQCFKPVKAMEFYVLMLRDRVLPSSFSFSSLIKACRIESAMRFGESIHSQIWKNGFESHVFVQTTLIDFYSNLNKIVECMKVFEELSERDVFAWTTMITSYVRVGDMSSAHRLFEEMPERNVATWNTMIDGYAKLRNLDTAAALFNQMPVKDLITWTTMINCYSQNKQFREAVDVFQEMKVLGLSPDEVTISTVISACAHLGALQLGREIHHYVLCHKLDVDVYIGSALIDMYAKCGSLEKALVVFFKLREKNIFCWNAAIDGLAVHGHGAEALAMFNRMERDKVKPNWVTFISVLGACTHAGLVEEGRKIFLTMIQTYSISPGIEHYGCMVDLLSKAGLLDEALELTKTMTIKANSVVWGAILSGCKLHKNLAITKVALEKLMQLEPDNCGYYLLLINIYAEGNHWKEVAEVRKMMNDRGVQKQCPGSSWVELDGKVQEFVASDISHSMFGEICKVLHELDWKLKLENDVPEYAMFSQKLL